MQLKRLNLSNWRKHEDTEVKLGKLNVLHGKNFSGKTSIMQAIETVLSGKNEWAEGGKG